MVGITGTPLGSTGPINFLFGKEPSAGRLS